MFSQRMDALRARLAEAGYDVALITDDDAVYYLWRRDKFVAHIKQEPSLLHQP